MSISYHSQLGPINTPLSPAEALARFSPLRSCGIVPVRPADKRAVSSRWRYEDKNWSIEEGKATVFTRSISASAAHPAQPTKTYHVPPAAHDQLDTLRSRVSRGSQYLNKVDGYTSKKSADYRLYSIESERMSFQECGSTSNTPQNAPILPISSGPSDVSRFSSRVVELQGTRPCISASASQRTSSIAASLAQHAPVQVARNLAFPRHDNKLTTIARKAVGSGVSPTSSKKSDQLLIWTSETNEDMHDAWRKQGHNEASHNDISSIIEGSKLASDQVNHTVLPPIAYLGNTGASHHVHEPKLTSCGTICSSLESPAYLDRCMKRPKLPVRFWSDHAPELWDHEVHKDHKVMVSGGTSFMKNSISNPPLIQHRQHARRRSNTPHLNIPAFAKEALGFEPPDLLAYTVEDIDLLRDWLVYVLKLLFILYLAACVWHVIISVKDGILRALEPVFVVWSFVRWLCRGGG